MDNQVDKLSLEEECRIAIFKQQLKSLSPQQIENLAAEIFATMIIKDRMFKEALTQKLAREYFKL